MREHLETTHRPSVGTITLGELVAGSRLGSSERVHFSPRSERDVTSITAFLPGTRFRAGQVILHGPGPLNWQLVPLAADSGACAIVVPRSWPGVTSPMLMALAEAHRMAVYAVDPSTEWIALLDELQADARRVAETKPAAFTHTAQPWSAALLLRLLEGGPADPDTASLIEPGSCVLAIAPVQTSLVPGAGDEALDRALWLALLDPDIPSDAEGVRIGSTVYVVLRRARGNQELRRIAEHVRRLLTVTIDRPVLAAVGCTIELPNELEASRREADRVLALSRRRTSPATSTLADVQHLALLEEAAAVLNAKPHLMSQKLALLRRSDATRNTSYITVLRAFLDNLGDVNNSAERLGMHHNTFRYRLKRGVEVAGINLDDSSERLALQVELAVGD